MTPTVKSLRFAMLFALLATFTGCPVFERTAARTRKKAAASRPAVAAAPDHGLDLRRRPMPETAHAHGARAFDVDADGTVEIVTSGFDGQVYILDRNGKGVERVRLEASGKEQGGGEVEPLNLGGATYWLQTSMNFYGDELDLQNIGQAISLHRRDGKRLWQHSLDSAGQHAMIECEVARLRSRQTHEVIVIAQLMGGFGGSPDAEDFQMDMTTLILVLDAASGKVIGRRTLDEFLGFHAVIPAATPDGLDTFVFSLANEVVTCTLAMEADAEPASAPSAP